IPRTSGTRRGGGASSTARRAGRVSSPWRGPRSASSGTRASRARGVCAPCWETSFSPFPRNRLGRSCWSRSFCDGRPHGFSWSRRIGPWRRSVIRRGWAARKSETHGAGRSRRRRPMTLDQLINVLVTITLIEMMAAIGLGVTFVDLAGVARNWRLVGRAALANYVCVPAVTVGLLLLFAANQEVAAGFLILAVCPGAPCGPPFVAIAKGNVAVAVGLMAILAGSSAIIAPILLQYLLPLASGNESL